MVKILHSLEEDHSLGAGDDREVLLDSDEDGFNGKLEGSEEGETLDDQRS